jgi:hypothetical protein
VKPTTYRKDHKIIHREGYTYMRKDVGAPGRTPPERRVIPPLEEGELSKHLPVEYRDTPFFEAPPRARHQAYRGSVKEDGMRTTMSRLTALQVLNKRTNPRIARKAAKDREWIRKNLY